MLIVLIMTIITVGNLLAGVSKVTSKDEVIWYDTEIGRFLCFDGLSGGNTTFFYEADYDIQRSSQNLPDVVDISENVTDCNIEYGCRQTCLSSVVKSHIINTTVPRPYVLKRSACVAANNSVKDGDSFRFVLLLVFGVVSMEYRGKHQFTIIDRGNVDVVSTNVTVSPANIKTVIEIRDVVDLKLNLKWQDNYDVVCEVTGRNDVNANVSWVRDNGKIPQLHNTNSCNRTSPSVFYTVKYSEVRITDYPNNTFNNSVIASSFTMRLYFCKVTTTLMDLYSCEGYGSRKPLWLSVDKTEDNENELEVALIIGFIVLNSVLLIAIGMTLAVLGWIRHSNKKQSCNQLSHNAGLPVYLHSAQQIDTNFFQGSDLKNDPMEFPADKLELLHPLGKGNVWVYSKASIIKFIWKNQLRNVHLENYPGNHWAVQWRLCYTLPVTHGTASCMMLLYYCSRKFFQLFIHSI